MNIQSNQLLEEIKNLRIRISELEKQNQELLKLYRVNESLYLNVLDALPINIFLEDPEGHTIFANKQTCKVNEKSLNELVGKTVFDLFPREIAEINRANDLEVWNKRKLITKETPAGFKGQEHYMFTGKTIIHVNESDEEFLLGFGLDITDRVRTEALLRESEEKFRGVIEQAADSIFLIGTDGVFMDVNPTACEVLKFSKEELLKMKVERVFITLQDKIKLHSNSKEITSENFEDLMECKDNNKIPVDINIREIKIGEKKMFLAMCRDIREKKRAEAQIKQMAYHDPLTNLPNRWYIQSQFQRFISNKDTYNRKLGVILLDLDHFKFINDSLGHDAGDQLLKEVSKRIQIAIDDREAFLARFGGDEFILLVPLLKKEGKIGNVCEKIKKVMAEPFKIYGQKFNISASMGISFYPADGENLNTLIKNADLAMYDSKDKGRNCYTLYNYNMKKHAIVQD